MFIIPSSGNQVSAKGKGKERANSSRLGPSNANGVSDSRSSSPSILESLLIDLVTQDVGFVNIDSDDDRLWVDKYEPLLEVDMFMLPSSND